MPISRRVLVPVALAAIVLACGDPATPEDPLAGLDEMAIYSAIVDRMGLLSHTTEANNNLRQAVSWPDGPFDPGMFGQSFAYEPGAGWMATEDQAVASNMARVTWYRFNGGAVAIPVSARGYIDLTHQPDPAAFRLRVQIVADPGTELADYTIRLVQGQSAATPTLFRVDGVVGDGIRDLQVKVQEEHAVAAPTGNSTSLHNLELTEGAFRYVAVVTADSAAATGQTRAGVTAFVTLDGVTTRLELDVEGAGAAISGAGFVSHAGVRIAEVAVTGGELDMTFTRPDGAAFTSAQRSRLGTLVTILLMPVWSVQTYFS
jgi:hypothetical protein